jgi:hypothetical protein
MKTDVDSLIRSSDWRRLGEFMNMSYGAVHAEVTKMVAALNALGYELRPTDGAVPPVPARERRVVVHVLSDDQLGKLSEQFFDVLAESADLRDCGMAVTYETEIEALVAAVRRVVAGPAEKITPA